MEKKFRKQKKNSVIICTINTDKYWSVTYEELGKDGYFISGGCNHKKIIKHFPSLEKFCNMHLSDSKTGLPMYFQDNGIYHLQNSTMETVCKHFRVDLEEARTLFFKMKEDSIGFYKHLSDLTIRYEKENKQLKQELNEL